MSALPMESSANLETDTFESLTIFPQLENDLNYDDIFSSLFPNIDAVPFATSQLSLEEPFISAESSSVLEASDVTSTMKSTQDPQDQYNTTRALPLAESNDNSISPVFNPFSGNEPLEFPEIDVFQNLEALLFGAGGDIMASRVTEVQDDNSTLQVAPNSVTQETLPQEVNKPDTSEQRDTTTRRTRRVLGPVKGNNRKGRAGGLRCMECRKVHLKCIFSDENNPCTRCQSKGLACKKVLGEKGEASRILRNLVSTVSIPRSPSPPGYFPIPADEQHAIDFLYGTELYWRYGINVIKAMRGRGIYVQNPCLRYAILTMSAYLQSNESKCELYQSKYESAIRKVSKRRSDIDVLHATVFMSLISRWKSNLDAMEAYLDDAVEIVEDGLNGRININLTSEAPALFDAIGYLRVAYAVKPISMDNLEIANGRLSPMDLTMSQCQLIEPFFGNLYGEGGRKLYACITYVGDICITIRLCFLKYLESKLKRESPIDMVVPLLQRVQKRMDYLQNDNFFADITAMDMLFVGQKLRPVGIVNDPMYHGIVYPESGIDSIPLNGSPQWYEHVRSGAESVNPTLPDITTSQQPQAWFKRNSGLMRREFWADYNVMVILLNIIETMLYGYSARDGGDAAVKLVLLIGEVQSQLPTLARFPAMAFSLAELQLRRLGLLDELTWVLSMKHFTSFTEIPYLPDWSTIQDDVEICIRLLTNPDYFFSL